MKVLWAGGHVNLEPEYPGRLLVYSGGLHSLTQQALTCVRAACLDVMLCNMNNGCVVASIEQYEHPLHTSILLI